MSVWNDIRKRGIGGDIKGEDFSQVYTGEKSEGTELYSDQYSFPQMYQIISSVGISVLSQLTTSYLIIII